MFQNEYEVFQKLVQELCWGIFRKTSKKYFRNSKIVLEISIKVSQSVHLFKIPILPIFQNCSITFFRSFDKLIQRFLEEIIQDFANWQKNFLLTVDCRATTAVKLLIITDDQLIPKFLGYDTDDHCFFPENPSRISSEILPFFLKNSSKNFHRNFFKSIWKLFFRFDSGIASNSFLIFH